MDSPGRLRACSRTVANWLRFRARPTPGVLVVRQVLALTAVIAIFVVTVVSFRARILAPNEEPHFHLLGSDVMNTSGFESRCGPPRSEPFVVTFVHSPDKQVWLEEAAAAFMKRCPNTQVTLVALEDLAAAKAIADGELAPTVWSPSDSLFLDVLDARVGQPVAVDHQPPLLRSPMVLLTWSDRVDALDALLPAGLGGADTWASAACPMVDEVPGDGEGDAEPGPASWASWWAARHESPSQPPPRPSPSELERWGAVAVRHASPTRSATGLLGLYLIAHDFLARGAELPLEREALATALDQRQLALHRWLRRCEFDQPAPLASGALLTESLFNLGGRGYDAVITDEHLALEVLARGEGREDAMRVARLVYPAVSLVRDHPELRFEVADPGVSDAARRFGDSLRELEPQRRAVELGFRPTHPKLSLRDYDRGPNPFTSLRRYGVELEPELREPARLDGASVAALVELWGDATGR